MLQDTAIRAIVMDKLPYLQKKRFVGSDLVKIDDNILKKYWKIINVKQRGMVL